jgi:hypothetical protein
MDSILSNTVHTNPFWGSFRCPWCNEILVTTGLPTLIQHILIDHRKLQTSNFSCPSCIGVAILTWESWPTHWVRCHEPGQALAMVLNEAAPNIRYGWGIAMIATLSAVHCLGVQLEDGEEPDGRVGPWGGYCPKSQGTNTLARQIKNARESVLPAALREARQPTPTVRQPVGRQTAAASVFRRASFASVATFASTRPGTPAEQEPKSPRAGQSSYDPGQPAAGPPRLTPYQMPEYRPSSLSLETPNYEPVTPARAAQPNGSQYEKPFDELQMAMDLFPSDGSARGEEPSDLQLDQEEATDTDLTKDAGEDDEMGDNF